MAGINWAGSIVDLNTVQKRIGRLKNFISRNEVSLYKALSTTILADVTALNTLIQASSSNQDLSTDPVIDIHDDPEQTADS